MKEKETITVLITNADDFSWYKKLIGEKFQVYKDTKHIDIHEYYVTEKFGYILSKHCLTIIEQRGKKLTKILK